ncbi:MAG: PAS domain-containing protein, partial [Leptolyngbyaceae cyanobacterium]
MNNPSVDVHSPNVHNALMAAVVESCSDAIITYDCGGRITSWNQAAVQLLGYTKADAVGQTVEQILSPHAEELLHQRDGLQSGQMVTAKPVETTRRHQNGTAIHVSIALSLLRDESGQVLGFAELIREIPPPQTQLNHDSLTVQRMESLFHQAPMMKWMFDADGNCLKVNRACADYFQMSIEDSLGLPIANFLPESVATLLQHHTQQLVETEEQSVEFEAELEQGQQRRMFRFTVFATVSDCCDTFWAIATDITAYHQALADLRHSEYKNTAILKTIPDLIYLVEADGTYRHRIKPNRAVDALRHVDDPVGANLSDYLPPHVADIQKQAIRQTLETGELQIIEQEITIDGHLQYEEVRIVKSQDDEALLLVRDISDRKRLENERQQQAAQTQSILESLPDLVFRVGGDGHYRGIISSDALAITSEDGQVEGHSLWDLVPEAIASRKFHHIRKALHTGETQCYEQQFELDGDRRDEEVRIVPIGADEVLTIIRDISDRKYLEAELKRSEAQNRAMLTTIPDLMYLVDEQGFFLSYFPSHEVYNFKPNTPIGRHLLDYSPESPLDQETFLRLRQLQTDSMAEALDSQTLQVYDQSFFIGDEQIWEEVRVIPCDANEVLFIVRDTTQRHQAATERQRAEQQLKEAQRIAHLGDWVLDHQTNQLTWSDEIYRIF